MGKQCNIMLTSALILISSKIVLLIWNVAEKVTTHRQKMYILLGHFLKIKKKKKKKNINKHFFLPRKSLGESLARVPCHCCFYLVFVSFLFLSFFCFVLLLVLPYLYRSSVHITDEVLQHSFVLSFPIDPLFNECRSYITFVCCFALNPYPGTMHRCQSSLLAYAFKVFRPYLTWLRPRINSIILAFL